MAKTILENGYQKLNHTRHGLMLFNKNDIYIGRSLDLYGEWAWPELDLLKKYAVGQVVDVGANIGTHTLVFAQTAKQVISIEPQYIIFQTLMANLAINCLENVIPHFGALGKENSTTRILRPDYTVEGNFGCVTTSKEGQLITLTKLDSLNLQPDLIKIDAEGCEGDILAGARETIKRTRPVLYVENDRDDTNTLIRLIQSFEYECSWHKPLLFQQDNFYGNSSNEFGDTVSKNLICYPQRRTYAVKERVLQENCQS